MRVYNTPKIFQEKIYKLLDVFDRIHMYVGEVIIISKDNFTDNVKALEKVLKKTTEE